MDEMIPETRLKEEQFGVAVMTGTFSNRDGSGSQPQKRFDGGANELSVCIHGLVRDVLDKVGFEENGFPADIQIEKSNAVINKLVELFRILIRRENGDSRSGGSDISDELSAAEICRQCSTGRSCVGKEQVSYIHLGSP
jgi:hypothetical protein